ncbi:Mce associated membrane protein [Mycobacterium cookii]|uniref:Mce associated membrane protein n=1 Tax=Mycobacterium cookii TaxID=1775 RepID=A0A7I7KRM3_9MYCO|nr:mammalian cell entry protein [Mycobacterium cookii]BBX44770.1 Mce associated membrane protein [Mycobacterium cookii]
MQAVVDSEPHTDNEDIRDVDDCASEPAANEMEGERDPRRATLFGLAIVAALAILVGWLGFHAYQSQQPQAKRQQFLQTARQGALNLTTIDWQHADADVHRILDGATGEFYDDFAKRSQPFIEVLKQSKAKTVGTITQAGLESETADSARALVAVSVLTSDAAAAQQVPREWRMRIDVQKLGDQVKISNVGFVP